MLNYDALMAFATFAEHRNFTAAARTLHISQPALHQKVNKLADELGLQLYVRDGRELRLTPAGEELAAHARHVASLTEEALARASSRQKGPVVSIASGPGALLHLVAPVMPAMMRGPHQHRLLQMRGREAAAGVREARYHVAIGVFDGNREGLDCHDWFVVNQQVIVPRSHRLAARERVEVADLDGESLIVPPLGHPNRETHERLLDGVRWTTSVEALGYDLSMAFVQNGMGLTIANDFIGLPDGVVGVPIDGFPTVTFEVAVREGTTHAGTLWTRDFLLASR